MLEAKLPRASTITELCLELENRCKGKHQDDFGNIYLEDHHSSWKKLKYKMGWHQGLTGL